MQNDFFEWDDGKAALNLRKHGVSFVNAICVLSDDAVKYLEKRVMTGEVRYLTLGMGCNFSLLVVAWTMRGERVRIISARKASKQERQMYKPR